MLCIQFDSTYNLGGLRLWENTTNLGECVQLRCPEKCFSPYSYRIVHSGIGYSMETSCEYWFYLGRPSSKLLRRLAPQSSYICRVQSSVWRLPKYWPPTPSPPSECVLPPHHRRGDTHLLGGEGVGAKILEDARHWIGFLQFNPYMAHTVLQCSRLYT